MNRAYPMRKARAFTLVELLVATVVLMVILLMLVAMVNQTATIWRTSSAKVEQFRSARTAFDSINRHLSQATLNTYFDYDTKNGIPTAYKRQSDLRFIVGGTEEFFGEFNSLDTERPPVGGPGHAVFFHAPVGFTSDDQQTTNPTTGVPMYSELDNLLNMWGYFVEYGSDYNYRPAFLNNPAGSYTPPPERHRYRLMEFMVPSDRLTIYRYTSSKDNSAYHARDWFEDFLKLRVIPTSTDTTQTQARPTHLLAENIIELVVWPQLSRKDQDQVLAQSGGGYLAPGYSYDSAQQQVPKNGRIDPRNQLPPVVQVTMVAMDEASGARVEANPQKKNQLQVTLDKYFVAQKIMDPQGLSNGNSDSQTASSATKYNADLQNLQTDLVTQGIAYRTFTTTISLRAAKWSQD